MISKTFAAGLLVAGCVSAAAGGGYMAMRQNEAAARPPLPPLPQTASAPAVPAVRAVAETEAVVSVPSPEPAVPTPGPIAPPRSREMDPGVVKARPVARTEPVRNRRPSGTDPRDAGTNPATSVVIPAPSERPAQEPAVPPVEPVPDPVRAPEPPRFPEPQYDEVVLPAASVVGLQIETTVSSERARVEDRVDARVTRDVSAAGRLAIPAGSHVIGSVTLVERGGKAKETARLGVRFHTLVLADGREIPLRTEAILREGDSPAAESARKIGGAAIGGAILGAIMGGKKGAVMGGAAGAAGGTAAVVNGDRNAATLPSGTVVTVKLTSPATIDVERR